MTPTRNKKRLDTAQRKVAKARSEISTQRRALAAADAALSRVQRTHPPDDPNVAAVILRHDAAERALRSARDKERAARDDLHGALEAWLEGLGAGDLPEAQTLSTDWPILLLPARLETRFAPPEKPTELLVRIFPDEITADSFDETLSPAEAELGKSYWKAAKRGDRGAEDAWRDLVQHVPGPRASWIKAATDPSAHRDPGIRASKWARSPEARVLPDRWLVVAYRGGKAVHHAMSRAIVDPLVLWSELSRGQTDALLDLSGDGLKVDPDAAWMFQFDQALTAGMAVVFRPLVPDDLRFGFDRIIAIGVKASLAPDLAAERLASLFRAHRYSKGFALVSQGTPTNNTAEARTGFPPDDAGGAESFGLEHGSRHVSEEEDGAHLAKALGLLNRLAEDLPKVAGAHGCEQVSARVMNEALWPATGGYFLEQMLGPELGPDAINFAQTHFVEHVRGRGPLPAFRIGATPYGVLPVSSLARWKPDAARPLEGVLSTILRTLLPYWLKGVDAVPRVGRSGDAERDLLDILLMDASAREVRVRRAWGGDLVDALVRAYGSNISGLPDPTEMARRRAAALAKFWPLLRSLGWKGNDPPRVARMGFEPATTRFGDVKEAQETIPLVTLRPLSESEPLEALPKTADYIAWVSQATLASLRDESLFATPPLLFLLLRRGMLLTYYRTALDLLIEAGLATDNDRREPELVDIPLPSKTGSVPPAWSRFDASVPTRDGPRHVREVLESGIEPYAAHSNTYRNVLVQLSRLKLSTAELERLLTETLDTFSHRLDAWITSLATQRLSSLRALGKRRSEGCHLGAYAWLEDLRFQRERPPTGGSLRPLPSLRLQLPPCCATDS